MKKNIYTILSIVIVFTCAAPLIHAQNSMSTMGIEVDIFEDIDLSGQDDRDEFDTMSDNMTKSGMPLEAPKPVSDFQYWVRRLGSPFLLKYLAVKTYIRSLWNKDNPN